MSGRFHIPARIALLGALLSVGGFAEDRYLVRLTGDVNAFASRHGLTVVKSLTGSAAGQHVLSSKGVAPQTMLRELAAEFAVRNAEAEKPVLLPGIRSSRLLRVPVAASATRIPSTLIRYYTSYASSAYVNQPATDVIRMDMAHTLATGRGVVATIDTGVDFTHPVLRDSLTWGWDFVHNWPLGQEQADLNQETTPILDQETTPILDQETTPILDGGTAIILQQETTPILDQETTPILDGKTYPAYGHGTMVAGLIHLVAPNAKIMPLRAFGADGSATMSQIVQAIYFAVDRGVDVINMSFSLKQDSPLLQAALDYAVSKGVICVASAGNDGSALTPVWPAAYANVIGVGATDNQAVRSAFSNYGNSLVTLAAPGEGVLTTYPMQHYAMVSGTSFSAPMVSGAVALLLEVDGRTNQAGAVSDLSHATAIGQEMGAGELDLVQAILAARK